MTRDGLSCTDLVFAYRKSSAAIFDGLSIEFDAGALTTITGPSGSGKSTLLYVLSLLMKPLAGTINWNGNEISSFRDDQCARWRARTTGFIFQDAMLDPARTVLDNVCEPAVFMGMSLEIARERAYDLLEQFGVVHRALHRPGEVSGGQAQRVGLCRALLNDPKVIFADEPTGNLDSESAGIVWEALRKKAAQGTTILVATHDDQLADQSDERVRL